MPMITINCTRGRSSEQKQAVVDGILQALETGAGVAPEHVWIVFDETEAEDFFIGSETIAERRRKRSVAPK